MKNLPRLLFLCALLVVCSPVADAGYSMSQGEGEERGLKVNAEGAFQGYTIFSPLRGTDVYLIDMEGRVVHEWQMEYPPTGGVYLLDSGHLVRGAREPDQPRFGGGGLGGRVQEFDWDGNLVWEFLLADDYQSLHHDIEPLPNGNFLMIAWEHRFREDAIEAGRAPGAIDDRGIWATVVLEIEPQLPSGGDVVWEWHVWDHLVQDFDADRANYGSVPDHPELVDLNADHRDDLPLSEEERERLEEELEQMRALGYVDDDDENAPTASASPGSNLGSAPDWLHMNAVDYNAELDLIVLSSPTMSEVWVIDHALSTEETAWHRGGRWGAGGDLLFRWGNPSNYGLGESEDQQLFYQHNPSWVASPAGEGPRLLIYNNGSGRPDGSYSSVDELLLPFDPESGFSRKAGAAYGPPEPSASYSDGEDFFSGFISGAQRMPNGNTLICEGAKGRIFEVTPGGQVVWDYWNPFVGNEPVGQGGNSPPVALFRATRFAKDHPALVERLGK